MLSFFFFFQAEDGIRDLTVTGVQTCALPISGRRELWVPASRLVPPGDTVPLRVEIGRASCKGKSVDLGGRRIIKKKKKNKKKIKEKFNREGEENGDKTKEYSVK